MWQNKSTRWMVAIAAALLVAGGIRCQTPEQRSLIPAEIKTPAAQLEPGSFHALVIGNAKYQTLNELQTPLNDADEVARVLEENFSFEVKRLPNATRIEILSALNDYRRTLPENSSLLVYYGGHGYRENDEAYWLPVDAASDNHANWISSAELSTNLRAIQSRHILIISDSCYSGGMSGIRSIQQPILSSENVAHISSALSLKSRILISSGTDQPVEDSDRRDNRSSHSVFANALLEGLADMQRAEFTSADLFFGGVDREVEGNTPGQRPTWGPIVNSGDERGDFVFLKGNVPELIVDPRPGRTPDSEPQNPEFQRIASALRQYEDAYSDESVPEMMKVWPLMSRQQQKGLERTFDTIHAMRVHLDCKMPLVTGQDAHIGCSQKMQYTEKGKRMPTQRDPVDITVKNTALGWQITAIQAAPRK